MSESKKFVQTIRKLYHSLRTTFAFFLIIVAFLSGQIQIPIIKESALLAATLIIVSLLFEIHKEILASKSEKKFARFHDAALKFRSQVGECVRKNRKVEIKWLGMGMDYGAPMLDDIISNLKIDGTAKKIKLSICMLDPSWNDISNFNDTWQHKGKSAIQSLCSLYNRTCNTNGKTKINLIVYMYKHMPNWHGFIVNDRFLYQSKCSWDGKRLLGGENEYEFVDCRENEEARKKVNFFLGWFKYCSKEQLDFQRILANQPIQRT